MSNTSATGGYLAPSSELPLEDGAFDAVLQGFVVGVTALAGNLVRPRWQPIPPPTPDPTVNWCAIGVVVEDPAEGKGFITHDGSDNGGLGSDTLQVNDEVEVLASFYGPAARSYANLMRGGMMVPQNREGLQLQGYKLCCMPSRARFVPEIVNQQTYRRVDVSFRIVRSNVTVWPVENLLEVQGEVIADNRFTDAFDQGSTPP